MARFIVEILIEENPADEVGATQRNRWFITHQLTKVLERIAHGPIPVIGAVTDDRNLHTGTTFGTYVYPPEHKRGTAARKTTAS